MLSIFQVKYKTQCLKDLVAIIMIIHLSFSETSMSDNLKYPIFYSNVHVKNIISSTLLTSDSNLWYKIGLLYKEKNRKCSEKSIHTQ